MSDQNDALESLLAVMRTLRSPEGCPWDREQSSQSIKNHLIEEAYEVVDAIDQENVLPTRRVGRCALQLIFHAQINEEEGHFTFLDVISTLREKLIRGTTRLFFC